MQPETMMLSLQARSVQLRADSFDPDANTVDLVWTTGAPVLRYDWRAGTTYIEVLDVTPKAVRLGRLNAGAPFLNTHSSCDLSDIIGSVVDGSARLADGEGLATMQLSRDPAHAGIVANIGAKVIRNISVGYLVHQVVKTESDDGTPATWRVTDWEPIELSAVPIPADPGAQMRSTSPTAQLYPCQITVETRAAASPRSSQSPAAPQAARAAATEEAAMSETTETDPAVIETRAAPAAAAAPQAQAADATAIRAAETARIQGIMAVGRKLRLAAETIDKAIAENVTLDAFRAQAIDAAADQQERAAPAHTPGGADPAHRLYAEPAEKLPKGINATRIMMALASARGSRTDAAAYVAQAYGRAGEPLARALSTSIGSAGGFLVPPEMATEVIELLRPESAVMSLNPRIIPMPSGNLTINGLAGGALAGYVGENQPAAASQEAFRQVQLSAKKLAAVVPISNDMIKYPTVATDEIVRDDMVASIAMRADLAFTRGTGGQFSPRGFRSFVSAPALGGANLMVANPTVNLANITVDCGKAELALLNANVKMKRPGWIMAPRTMTFLMNIRDGLGNQIYLAEMTQGRFRGKPFRTTTQVPTNLAGTDSGNNPTIDASELYLADFAEVFIGEAFGLEIEVFPGGAYIDANGVLQSGVSNDQTVMRAIVQHDMGMRQEAAIAMLTNVRWF